MMLSSNCFSCYLQSLNVSVSDVNLPVYIEFPDEVLQLRVDDLTKRVNAIEKEFYSSFSISELEADLLQLDDDEDYDDYDDDDDSDDDDSDYSI